MTISVVISMDKVPSVDNRRIMKYLLGEVDNLKQMFDIHVNIISRKNRDKPEAAIQIGQKKPVFGYSRIIPELKAAVGRVAAVAASDDPFLDYVTKNIGTAEDDKQCSLDDPEKQMASAFTRATSEREKRNQLQKPPKPGSHKNGESPKISVPSVGGRSGSRPATAMTRSVDMSGDVPKGDAVFTKRHMSNIHESGHSSDPSNSDITDLGNTPGLDPMAAKFWSNQFTTEGI